MGCSAGAQRSPMIPLPDKPDKSSRASTTASRTSATASSSTARSAVATSVVVSATSSRAHAAASSASSRATVSSTGAHTSSSAPSSAPAARTTAAATTTTAPPTQKQLELLQQVDSQLSHEIAREMDKDDDENPDTAKPSAGFSLVGDWKGRNGRGFEQSFTFREDGTGVAEASGFEKPIRYNLVSTTVPMLLEYCAAGEKIVVKYAALQWVHSGEFKLANALFETLDEGQAPRPSAERVAQFDGFIAAPSTYSMTRFRKPEPQKPILPAEVAPGVWEGENGEGESIKLTLTDHGTGSLAVSAVGETESFDFQFTLTDDAGRMFLCLVFTPPGRPNEVTRYAGICRDPDLPNKFFLASLTERKVNFFSSFPETYRVSKTA